MEGVPERQEPTVSLESSHALHTGCQRTQALAYWIKYRPTTGSGSLREKPQRRMNGKSFGEQSLELPAQVTEELSPATGIREGSALGGLGHHLTPAFEGAGRPYPPRIPGRTRSCPLTEHLPAPRTPGGEPQGRKVGSSGQEEMGGFLIRCGSTHL